MTNGTGAIRARHEYDPYGRRTKVQGDLDSDFAFTGHYVHSPSGLYLALYRAYDAETGRWLSRDPIGEHGGLNSYNYVANNPINSLDSGGLWGIQFGQNGVNLGSGEPGLVFTARDASNTLGEQLSLIFDYWGGAHGRYEAASENFRTGGRTRIDVDPNTLDFS